jgi:RNAse (barnase) inhibitor barstar
LTTYEIDGKNFSTLEGFYEEISCVMMPHDQWGQNLDAFNDILRGGFGTPADGFTIRWKNHLVSKERLGYPETVRQLRLRLSRCHPTNRAATADALRLAESLAGATVFDWIVDIILRHSPGGPEGTDGFQLGRLFT